MRRRRPPQPLATNHLTCRCTGAPLTQESPWEGRARELQRRQCPDRNRAPDAADALHRRGHAPRPTHGGPAARPVPTSGSATLEGPAGAGLSPTGRPGTSQQHGPLRRSVQGQAPSPPHTRTTWPTKGGGARATAPRERRPAARLRAAPRPPRRDPLRWRTPEDAGSTASAMRDRPFLCGAQGTGRAGGPAPTHNPHKSAAGWA